MRVPQKILCPEGHKTISMAKINTHTVHEQYCQECEISFERAVCSYGYPVKNKDEKPRAFIHELGNYNQKQ